MKSPIISSDKMSTVQVGETRYSFYDVGQGPVVLLIHGYSETAQMWRPLMERWRSKYRMIAPDLKGIGETSIAEKGYDKKSVAEDMRKILDHLEVRSAMLIGHDIGLMVAYAFAAQFPQMTEKLVLMDAFLPGVGPGTEVYDSPSIWHFRFHGPQAEELVRGRERIFLDSLWEGFAAHSERFTEAQKERYTRLYARPGRMRASWEHFKAIPQDAKDNQRFIQTKLKMPVLSLGGEKSLGQVMAATVKEIAEKPSAKTIQDCGHWMIEECETETVASLEEFLEAVSELPSQSIAS